MSPFFVLEEKKTKELCDFCLDRKEVAHLYWQRMCQDCFNDLFTTPEEHDCEVCGREKAKTIFAADLFICADCVLKFAEGKRNISDYDMW